MLSYKVWLENKDSQEKKDFLSGKTNKYTPKITKRRGHPTPLSGSGTHDNRPRKQRTRQGQKRTWAEE
jgi:hypothetical protein